MTITPVTYTPVLFTPTKLVLVGTSLFLATPFLHQSSYTQPRCYSPSTQKQPNTSHLSPLRGY